MSLIKKMRVNRYVFINNLDNLTYEYNVMFLLENIMFIYAFIYCKSSLFFLCVSQS